ncbi:MAG: HNH endonuclease [Mycoplasmataceae bacterium]|jgi:5-methylcytosine-specific restriction endonuclease McrA|nr:HNH endonuclease [Mycoplasmataceae bacterium]
MNKSDRSKYLKSKEWKEFRKTIIERDKSKCQLCGRKTTRPKCHHIIQDKNKYEDLDSNNFSTLCSGCHSFITSLTPSVFAKTLNNKTIKYMGWLIKK